MLKWIALMALLTVQGSGTGVWVPSETFAQANVACMRVYTCRPSQSLMIGADQRVATTPPERVWGVCDAGGGDISSCNVCRTNPPVTPCRWWVEPDE